MLPAVIGVVAVALLSFLASRYSVIEIVEVFYFALAVADANCRNPALAALSLKDADGAGLISVRNSCVATIFACADRAEVTYSIVQPIAVYVVDNLGPFTVIYRPRNTVCLNVYPENSSVPVSLRVWLLKRDLSCKRGVPPLAFLFCRLRPPTFSEVLRLAF